MCRILDLILVKIATVRYSVSFFKSVNKRYQYFEKSLMITTIIFLQYALKYLEC